MEKLQNLRRLAKKNLRFLGKGQSLVETAILFPVLLILLSGLLEFGFILNEYLTLQDAIRNAARFSSDSDYTVTDGVTYQNICSNAATGFPRETCCVPTAGVGDGTVDFFRQTACLVNTELNQMAPDITLDCQVPGPAGTCRWAVVNPTSGLAGNQDDILISVFSVDQDGSPQIIRFGGANGWSYAENYVGYSSRNQNTRFSVADIASRLDSTAPNTGYVLVEVFYNYDQKLKLPWITAFVPDPVMLHAYTIMPLTSAEPTPTPISP